MVRTLVCLGALGALLSACEDGEGVGANDPSSSSGASDASSSGASDASSSGEGGTGGMSVGGAGGNGGQAPIDPCSGFAVSVVDVTYGEGAGFGQDAMPGVVLGPPQGTGSVSGSLDVVSLGNGGVITLGFGDQTILDGEGPDFIVFENAFYAGGDEDAPFAELGTVEVSADGETWTAFPCDAVEAPYGACAGWHPVFAGPTDPTIDPQDPAAAGGDAFDLADIGVPSARFVRITDRADLTGLSGAFDLDAIALVHATCE